MTNELEHDFEAQLREMLKRRVAGMPESYAAPPGLVRRARRRRAVRLTGVVTAVVLVTTGTTTAVAQVLARHTTDRVAVSAPASRSTEATTTAVPTTVPATLLPAPRPSVATVACPATYVTSGEQPFPPPSTAPRVPAAGDPSAVSHLTSFAGTTDPRYVVLGPGAWSCQMQVAADGDNALVVYPRAAPAGAAPDMFSAPIAVENDYLWHGLSGLAAACRVSADPAVVAKAAQLSVPCGVTAGRVLTSVDSHVTTFVDASGDRGLSWILMPSSPDGADGQLSILTCRPTAGLTKADCDAIVADFAARLAGAG